MTLPNVQGLLRHDTVKTLRHVDFNTEDRGPIVERVDYVVVQSTMRPLWTCPGGHRTVRQATRSRATDEVGASLR